MTHGFQRDDTLRRAAAAVMATDDGKVFCNSLLAEWERVCVNAGKAQTNDLLRQFIGQAEGVRVIETLAGHSHWEAQTPTRFQGRFPCGRGSS